jgi:nucleoside-diphosphate-sugar epimerase
MEVSVFGGTGFIGSKFGSISNKKIHLIDRESRQPVCDNVLYMISTTDNYNIFENVHLDIDVNLSILVDVLKNLKPNQSVFNFVSSWFVYGDAELPAKESSHCNPKGFYSITKRCAEQLIISYCETFNINYRIFRLCNVFGPNDFGVSKKKNALQFLINQLKSNNDVNLYLDGKFYRDYMHVSDVCRAIDLCLEKAPLNEIINIGSGEKLEFKKIIDMAIEFTSSKSKIGTMEIPAFHKTVQVQDFYMNVDKLKSLGFVPQLPLKEGIRELCQ